ncbi:MAG: phosphoglucosamine mutase [Candidatus Brocadiia bacterium]|nr:MAG: phosphoglucosamine mutase [Candidatus Brocadiia bacterium]
MAEKLIISISGMRGIVGENLTPSIAAEYACAFGTFLKQNAAGRNKLRVCVGRDSRPSGQMLTSAVISGLCSVGINAIDLGLVITPSVGVMLRELDCEGGVMITASHNPIPYNGIKLLLADGMAPPAEKAGRIREIYLERKFGFVDSPACGKVEFNFQTYDIHIGKVLSLVDRKAVSSKQFKVVLDSVNGAGAPITKKLLAELGCQTIAINDEPTGIFEHTPEPLAENLRGLCEVVTAKKADIGFAQDPDADRLAIVDEKGRYIGEEYTLALSAEYILKRKKGPAATNLSTSRMIDDIARKAGCEVLRTPVGEANVASEMIKRNCVIGGEGNGGVIDLRVGPIRDSLVGIVLILQLMAETGKTVGQLVEDIGGYYMSKEKFKADQSQAEQIINGTKALFAQAKLDTSDGCRIDFEDGWLHLRTSNTEPVMRLIVEANDKAAAQKYINAVHEIRNEVMG